MFNLILQTALLVLAAFVLGAIAGCLMRRFLTGGSVYSSPASASSSPRSTPAETGASAAAATVAARMAKQEEEAAAARAKAEADEEAQRARREADAAAARAEIEAKAKAADEAAAGADDTMDEAAVEAALASLPSDASNEDKANAVGSRPVGLSAPTGGAADDLKKIKGIGKVNEGKLNGLGIYHFSQIRDWTPAEARWVGTFLAFSGRIEREDWIGQATTLADSE